MDINDKGILTQLANASATAGIDIDRLKATVQSWGGIPHTEARAKAEALWGLSLMHADTLVYVARHRDVGLDDAAAGWYSGKKEVFRPLHDALLARIAGWDGVTFAPKKTYVSARTVKQFATWGPATATRFEIGLNGKHLEPDDRLIALPPGQICHARIVVADVAELDDQVWSWIESAYQATIT